MASVHSWLQVLAGDLCSMRTDLFVVLATRGDEERSDCMFPDVLRICLDRKPVLVIQIEALNRSRRAINRMLSMKATNHVQSSRGQSDACMEPWRRDVSQ